MWCGSSCDGSSGDVCVSEWCVWVFLCVCVEYVVIIIKKKKSKK